MNDTATTMRRGAGEWEVTLHDGTRCDLSALGLEELRRLHWDEERAFARRMLESARGSRERAQAIRQGYETVSRILARSRRLAGREAMPHAQLRDWDLIAKLIRRVERETGGRASVFELGFGSGALLERAARMGARVGGLEVALNHFESARDRLPAEHHPRLHLGDFLSARMHGEWETYDIVYWDQVLEHIPPDEAGDYLARIRTLLRPGGRLVTITPNWHVRPGDVTADFRPPRTPAQGFHLKEYRLRELVGLLRAGGFERVGMPLCVLPTRTFLLGRGFIGLKLRLEPLLEHVPIRPARKLAGGMGYYCTVARRPARPG